MSDLPGRLVILGYPVAHSLSPRIQNAALAHANIPVRYQPLAVPPAELDLVLSDLRREGAGGNITAPHKSSFAERCDHLSEAAARAGAVNTFWMEDGKLVGDNTDIDGFIRATERLLGGRPQGTIAILGAGGAAAAVLAACERWGGLRATLYNRTPARAHALARRFGKWVHVYEHVGATLAGAQLVVNATVLGLLDHDPLPAELSDVPADAAVHDLVYRPGMTNWVRRLRADGRRATDGLTMLVEQGAEAFTRWIGQEPDRGVMWEAVGETRD